MSLPGKQPYVKKIGSTTYIRPKKTKTENLTPEQIEQKLADYVQVAAKDLPSVPLGTHIRYFKTENGKKKFCSGGILHNVMGLPVYFYLSNGDISWPVQTEGGVFFRKMTPKEIKEEKNKELEECEQDIAKLKQKTAADTNEYKAQINELLIEMKRLRDENQKLYKAIQNNKMKK